MKIGNAKITHYVSSSICMLGVVALITGTICYNGLIIELRVNHTKEYCPLCGIFGLEHQAKKVNQMKQYYAVYVEDSFGERVDIFAKEKIDEQKQPVLVKTIRR